MKVTASQNRNQVPSHHYTRLSLLVLLLPQATQARDRENIALRKPYACEPKPAYRHSTDAADATQLTDGEIFGSNWLAKTTVGWGKEDVPIRVTIDLGKIEPIDEVRVHSIGGGRANVFFPEIILLLVSDDGKAFHTVSSADSLALPQDRTDPPKAPRSSHTYVMSNLGTRGRYVLLVLAPDGDHVFTDEIEVWRGAHDPASVSFDADNAFQPGELKRLLANSRLLAEANETADRIVQAEKEHPGLDLDDVLNVIERHRHRPPLHREEACVDFRRLMRATSLSLLRNHTTERMPWVLTSPMRPLRESDAFFHALAAAPTPSTPSVNRRIDLSLWQGEYESAAVTLFNVDGRPLRVRPVLAPLRTPTGANVPTESTIRLRVARRVDAHGVGSIGDALVEVPPDGFVLQGFEDAELWLTAHNPELGPGRYDFALDLKAVQESIPDQPFAEMIQGSISIAPIRMPDKPTLKTCTWAYLERSGATKHAAAEALADMKAHYVNVQTLFWSSALPMPRLGPDGRVQFDFAKHDEALKRYEGADLYLFFWGLWKNRLTLPDMGEPMTPAWKAGVREWLTAWVAHLQERGIGYDRFAMYPFDEMIPDEFHDIAKFIKEVDPKIRIFANSRGDDAGKQMAKIAPYVDVWCLRDLTYGSRIGGTEQRLRKEAKAAFWSYDCARPAKGKPPYGYYRLQMWRAFSRGDSGCGFWTYSDPGDGNGSAWDDFGTIDGAYGVIYGLPGKPADLDLGQERIVPSRRWEAWRDGVEDYEYLVQLRRAIADARRTGRHSPADEAQFVLDRCVQDVAENYQDPSRVYKARADITDAILKLRKER